MSRRAKLAVAVPIAGLIVVAMALVLHDGRERWPPEWYVSPATNRAEHAKLRQQAIAGPDGGFPPSAATLDYLRNMAVGSATEPGERVDDVRVYFTNEAGANVVISGSRTYPRGESVYVLALRGRFSTASVSHPPGAQIPPFQPCVTLGLDPSTLFATSAGIGPCQDLSALGDSVELELD